MPTFTFHSRFSNYELVRVCKDDRAIGVGSGNTSWINETRGIKYKFTAAPDPKGRAPVDSYDPNSGGGLVGVLTIKTGNNIMVDGNGWLAADEPQGIERDDVAALMAHYAFAKAKDGEVGTGDFWLYGYEPEAKLPRPEDFRDNLQTAAVALDEEGILAMMAAERGSHARTDLLTEADRALAKVREERERMAAAKAEAEAADQWSEEDTNKRLQEICDRHGIEVTGTGANGLVKKSDLAEALRGHETLAGHEKVAA